MLDNPFHVAVYAEIAKNRIFERQSYVPRCHYPTVAYSRLMAAFVNSTLSLAPLHEGSFGPLRTQRGLLKPHFGNAKDGSNGTFGVPYRSDFRFGRRRPLFFIACESLFGSRVVFSRTDHLQGFFQDFIASGTQTFDPGMHRYVDPHTRMPGVRIVRIINSETESTKKDSMLI